MMMPVLMHPLEMLVVKELVRTSLRISSSKIICLALLGTISRPIEPSTRPSEELFAIELITEPSFCWTQDSPMLLIARE